MAEPITGIPAFGTLLQVMTSAEGVEPPTFATVFGVGDIDGPGLVMDEIETTSHSTGIPIKTFIPSLIDPGDLSFPCFWNPTDPTQSPLSSYGMERLFYDRRVTSWRLVAPDVGKTTRQFRGFVKELGEAYPVSGVVTKDTVVRISGAMTAVNAEVELTPTENLTVPKIGAPSNSIDVVSTDGIGWFPVASVPWITITSPTEAVVGDGEIVYAVAASTLLVSRSGTISVGDQVFDVTQLGV